MRHLAKTLVLITAFMAGSALAHGQHSVKFIFKTDVKPKLFINTYNTNGAIVWVFGGPHRL